MKAMRALKLAILPVLIFTMSACSQNAELEKLRQTAPKGTAFQHELAKQYLTYAEVAQRQGHYASSSFFAQKGLEAAYGNDLLPQDPAAYELLENKERPELRSMYDQTVEILSEELKNNAPVPAAGAVFFYDCMLDQLAIGGGADEYNYCKESWETAIGDLKAERSGMISEESLGEGTYDPAIPVERYLVYFALDDYSLNDAAERTVKLLFDELQKNTGSIAIAVNGHTDTTGSDRYNMSLSNRRAEEVKKMLVALGMDPETIDTFGFGETDLAVPTGDNELEPKNRRVEIIMQ